MAQKGQRMRRRRRRRGKAIILLAQQTQNGNIICPLYCIQQVLLNGNRD
jgi:hypothetical protein